MNCKKAKALIFLGWHFFIHLLRRAFSVFAGPRQALSKSQIFLEQYRSDHIFAITPAERTVMPSFSECYNCRLCDLACPDWNVADPLSSPSYLVAGYSRSLTDFAHLKTVPMSCETCTACEQACPQNVPIKRIRAFVNDHLRHNA